MCKFVKIFVSNGKIITNFVDFGRSKEGRNSY